MKKIFIILYFLSFNSFAQNAFFVDEKGKKTFMRDDAIEILVVDSRISYTEVDKEWEKYVRFKDLDYAIIGPHYFKSFVLINKKGNKESKTAYFVIAETATKKLLTYVYTVVSNHGSTDYYSINVVDNNNNILDFIRFNTSGIYTGARGKITPMMNKHFSDCPELMAQFNQFPDDDDRHIGVLGFFDKKEYIKCN